MQSTEDNSYSIHSRFDVEKHKQTYTNYLEVIITPIGRVIYAIPSHQEAMIKYYCTKHKRNRKQFLDSCPRDMMFDFDTWLMRETGCVQVWSCGYKSYYMNDSQRNSLINLINNGLVENYAMSGQVVGRDVYINADKISSCVLSYKRGIDSLDINPTDKRIFSNTLDSIVNYISDNSEVIK